MVCRLGQVPISRQTGHLVFWRFHFYGKCVNQTFASERCGKDGVLVVKTREDSALLRSNGDPDENTRYGILRPKRRNAFLIGSLWTTSD